MVKHLPANTGDVGLIPGSGRSPELSTPIVLPGKIPWTEEPGGLQSMGSQRVGQDLVTKLLPTPMWLTATLYNSSRT